MTDLRNGNGNGRTPGRSAPDAQWVDAARRGDKRAFVEIVARHQAMVCGVALGILGDFAASEDAAQEAFLTAWRKIHELREPERLRAWLGQIARNAALGHLRRQRGNDSLEHAPDLPDTSPAPDEAAANEDEAALVRESLARLPETYRLPLILFYREDQSVRSVAEALQISEDAVKQRLARGREMLRDRMSGLIETVLTRTKPTAVFTMTVAAAIGALAAPAVVAASVFAAASATATSTAAASTTPILTAMSTSKTLLVTTALVAVVCIPIGYHSSRSESGIQELRRNHKDTKNTKPQLSTLNPQPFENSALFAEWRRLHDVHGTTSEAMPSLYRAIADLKDPFRRRAFRAALMAEWVQIDPAGGLAFFLGKEQERDSSQRRQFFEEWLALDARAAVDTLMASGPGWEKLARDSLLEIARRVPARVAEIVARLPKSDNYWDTKVRDAFAIVAERGVEPARLAAEKMTGPNREQALAGVAQAWAKSDLDAVIAWSKSLPGIANASDIIRAGLLGMAAVDPAGALDRVHLIPPGGREGYFADTTGARVLREAARTDYDATVAWLAAHPGRLGHEDLMGLAETVTDRLNADPVGFLNRHAADRSLSAILEAINSAVLNDAGGQRFVIWEWIKTQPIGDASETLKRQVLSAAGYQDPALAFRLVNDLPRTAEGDSQVQSLASSLLNGGSMLHRFDKLLEQAPERLRQPLIDNAFSYLRGDTLDDPQRWIARLPQLPESARTRGTESIARAWAEQSPEDAVGWATSLAPGDGRNSAVAAIASSWARKDAQGAAEWVAAMPAGTERDRGAGSLVFAVAANFPREAWEWALSIEDSLERQRAAAHAAQMMAVRDAATARQWIESGPFPPEVKEQLQANLTRGAGRVIPGRTRL